MVNQKAMKFYDKKDWSGFLEVVSPLQKNILVAMGKNKSNAMALSRKIFASPNTISRQLVDLNQNQVLEKIEPGIYQITIHKLALFCDLISLKDVIELDNEEVETKINREIYDSAINLFEPLENLGVIHGNSHHVAQKLVKLAIDEFQSRKQLK